MYYLHITYIIIRHLCFPGSIIMYDKINGLNNGNIIHMVNQIYAKAKALFVLHQG